MAFWIVACSVVGLFLFLFAFGFFCFRNACRRRKRYASQKRAFGGGSTLPREGMEALRESRVWLEGQNREPLSVTSRDGLTLRGQLIETAVAPIGVAILFHGYHSSCARDLSLQAMHLHRAGYHLILTDHRSHGESEGNYICFGAKERLDVGSWCCLATRHFPSLPIVLFGLSMGASTVMMSASTPLPPSVCAIVADCGFSSPWEIIRNTLRHKHKIPPIPTIYFMNYWSRILAGFDFREISCKEALANSTIPVLLLHGEEDTFVPTKMSTDLAAHLPQTVQLLTFPHARHGQSVYYDTETYRQEVLNFLETQLRKQKS